MKITTLAAIAASVTLAGCSEEVPSSPTSVRLAIVSGAEHGGRPFHTPLTQEVTTSPVHFGDADGTGTALITLNQGQGEVCFELTVANLTPPAHLAHIHEAAPGFRGPPVVTLTPPTVAPDGTGSSAGCISDVDPALIKRIRKNPELFYVNVHTHEYPGGAVRGQLGK